MSALCRWRGRVGRRTARAVFNAALEHLDEGCVGSFSEIFDADPKFRMRGAVAQAWSVAELLRTYVEDLAAHDSEPRGVSALAVTTESLRRE